MVELVVLAPTTQARDVVPRLRWPCLFSSPYSLGLGGARLVSTSTHEPDGV